MTFRLRRTLTVDDVGRRVMVRFRLPDGGAQDVLGTLERLDDALVVRRRDGSLAVLAPGDLLAGHVVPPSPERRRQRPTPS